MSLRLRRQVPDAVRALATGERRLAWAVTESGLPLVATPVALHHGGEALPWTRVAKVGWAPPLLSVREVADVEDAGRLHEFVLGEDAGLAQVVHAQVTSSVAWSDVRGLRPSGKVRLVARREPGRDALLWQIVWLDARDVADPGLRAQADDLVAALRGTLG
jgi:hypothetical protein